MYGIYANIWGILMVNVTMYSIHGSYGLYHMEIHRHRFFGHFPWMFCHVKLPFWWPCDGTLDGDCGTPSDSERGVPLEADGEQVLVEPHLSILMLCNSRYPLVI